MGALDPAHYLDYAATSPVHPQVLNRWIEVTQTQWGNPSSVHPWGERAATVVEEARWQVAELLGVTPDWVIFTSGGTEANHMAFYGVVRAATASHPGSNAVPPHVIVSSVEHAAVAEVALDLLTQGWSVTWLPVDAQGFVSVADLEAAIRPETQLVSVIHGHNEVGSLQPVVALAQVCQQRGIPFHTDAVQSVGRVPLDLDAMGIDLLSLSGHKLAAPQGVGALLVRPGIPITPWLRGGGQETGLRSGTQAVASIAALGEAATIAQAALASGSLTMRRWQQQFHAQLSQIPALQLTGSPDWAKRLPHHLSYVVKGRQGSQVVRALAAQGLAISSGSACQRGRSQPSRVLQAMGYSPEEAMGGIRLSLGWGTTEDSLTAVTKALRFYLADQPRWDPAAL
ncbi:MAG: cysteine desulfurase family protein [Synechococcales cyanobacterium]